jgi:hypothetical protein
VYALPAVPLLTVTTGSGLTPATFTASGGSGSYKWNGYFDSETGDVKYTPAEKGTYTAAVCAEQQHGSLVCAGSYSEPATAVVKSGANGETCTQPSDCESTFCSCNICTDNDYPCFNGYLYNNIRASESCPEGWSRATTCGETPDDLWSLDWLTGFDWEYTSTCPSKYMIEDKHCFEGAGYSTWSDCCSEVYCGGWYQKQLCYRKIKS